MMGNKKINESAGQGVSQLTGLLYKGIKGGRGVDLVHH